MRDQTIWNQQEAKGFVRIYCILRSILGNVGVITVTLVYGILCIIVSILGRDDLADYLAYIWGKHQCDCYGLKVEGVDLHNLPEGGCLFVFNHSSDFDIPICHKVIRKGFRFGAKIELYKIPIFGQVLKYSGALPITRGDRAKVLALYKQSIPNVHAGRSYALAAEGTRMPVPGVGEKFKAGPFIFAIEGQFPIVPVVIKGAAEFLPKGSMLPGSRRLKNFARLQILPPVSTVGLTQDDRTRLQEEVRMQMTKAYAEL